MKTVCVSVVLVLCCGSISQAADAGSFPQGTWCGTIYGSYARSFTGETAVMGAGTIGGGYYILDNVALNAELSGYYNNQFGPDASITAGDLLLRHHILHSGRFSFFLDVGAGVSYADHPTPWYGTNFNFILEAGVGTTFQLWDNVHLLTGARYFHLSNGYKEGPEHNPSINATQIYIGLLFRF